MPKEAARKPTTMINPTQKDATVASNILKCLLLSNTMSVDHVALIAVSATYMLHRLSIDEKLSEELEQYRAELLAVLKKTPTTRVNN